MTTDKNFRLRAFCISLLFVTGACALIYEITWHRYLANLIGSESRASAIILSVFLGGLSIGYGLFGKLSHGRSKKYLLKLTGWLEVGIGLWAFFFPSFYGLAWEAVSSFSSANTFTLAHEIFLASTLILVPTILMGGTLPLLTQALSADIEDSGRIHAWIYSVNTGGAFFGCMLAGFFLLPHFGLPITLMIIAPFNLIAGISFIGVGTDADSKIIGQENKRSWDYFFTGIKKIFANRVSLNSHFVAFLCGFISISMQTALIRTIGLTAGSSEYAFAMVVGVFILMLAWGAFRVGHKPNGVLNKLWINQFVVAGGLIFLYLTIPYWPYSSHILRSLFTSVAPNFYIYHVLLFIIISLVLSLPILSMGRSMPLLFKAIAQNLEDVGQNVGSIYFVNTVGCVFGGIFGGYILYFYLDLDLILKMCILLALFTALLALLQHSSAAKSKTIAFSLMGILLLGTLIYPRWDAKYIGIGTFRSRAPNEFSYVGRDAFLNDFMAQFQIIYRRDGPTSSMTVTEKGSDQSLSRSIWVNGKSDGNTWADKATTLLMAHLPALFNTADLKNVAVIGFGTGMTAGTLGLYPQVEQIHVFEISPLVHEYAPLFDFADHDVSKNPKVIWHIGDAYQQLIASPQKYSLISSEPSNPWVLGIERLFTEEFLSIAHSRLEKGGVYAQWFHTYDISPATFKLVISTFTQVFPHVKIFSTIEGIDVAILGSDEPWDLQKINAMQEKLHLAPIKEDLEKINVHGPADLLSREILLPQDYFNGSGVHTLEFPKLSYMAGYDFFLASGTLLYQLQESHLLKVWNHKYAERNLAHIWLQQNFSKENLQNLMQSQCGISKPEIPENWKALNQGCRNEIARVVQQSLLPNKNYFSALEISLLNVMSGNSTSFASLDKITDPKEALHLLEFVTDYDSSFFKSSSDILKKIVRPCFDGTSKDHLKCQFQYADSLAEEGDWQLAAKQMELLSKSAVHPNKEVVISLMKNIEESSKAYATPGAL